MTAEPVIDNSARMSFSGQQLTGPVLSRVVGMLAARANCPIDRLDDAMLLCDALAAHAQRYAANGSLTVAVETSTTEISLAVGPLKSGSAKDLVAAADLPGVGNVIEQIADRVTATSDGGDDTLHLVVGFR